MKIFKKIVSWFRPKVEPIAVPIEEPKVEVYPKALEKMRCSTSCTGLDCKHHYDPEKITEHVVALADGTNLLISGKEFIEGPPYYVEGEPITAAEIWEVEGSNNMYVEKNGSKASRYAVPDLEDSGVEGEPVWVEGEDPYLIGGVPDEVKVPHGKKYTAFAAGFIDDPNTAGTPIKINKVKEFTETRNIAVQNGLQLVKVDDNNPLFITEEADTIEIPSSEYNQSDPLFVTDIAEEHDDN